MIRWVRSEYLLKGIFLGLLLFVALECPDYATVGRVAAGMGIGLGVGIALAMVRNFRYLGRLVRGPIGYFLFLLLENSFLIYAGVVFGLAWPAIELSAAAGESSRLVPCVLGGAVLGLALAELRRVRNPYQRTLVALVVGGGVVYGVLWWLDQGNFTATAQRQTLLGLILLIGLPFFYLLTFTGIAEESEAEIGSICVTLGLAIWLIQSADPERFQMRSVGFLLPVAIYFVYATKALPGLRVFKHVLRGFSYFQMGKVRPALQAGRRAVTLDAGNQMAIQLLERIHVTVDPHKLDAATQALLDPELCIARVRRMLAVPPTTESMAQAERLLALVESQLPKALSQVVYQRAVLALHGKRPDAAATLLADLLDPAGWFPEDGYRKRILFEAWRLALSHPALVDNVGRTQLALEGRRMEAIGAVERQLAITPDDPDALLMRPMLYEGLTEEEYLSARKHSPIDFSSEYAERLGMAGLGDPARRHQAALYLRLAADGQPHRAPGIYRRLADTYATAGDRNESIQYLKRIRDLGRSGGLEKLPVEERTIYFDVVKKLADEAAASGDWDEAILDYGLYTHAEGSGKETLRQLAEMYEKKHDIPEALRVNEKALLYDGKDADLLARKDKYYYSIDPETLKDIRDDVRKYFDVGYCIRKAKSLLDSKTTDLEMLDWSAHLGKLAVVMEPKNIQAMVLLARTLLRRGERDEALKLLEDVREIVPAKSITGGSEEQDAWYFAHKQLGKLYLDELGRPDMAIPCFEKYKEALGSGAETAFDLGRAHEAVGDRARALACYNLVTGYEGHPLAWEARQAMDRLRT